MQSLNLAYNDFIRHEMPTKFNRFVNLSYLNLSFTGFVGQIPIEISNLTNLVILDLSYTGFVGRIPMEISNLTKLVVLDLSTNYYSDDQMLELLDLKMLVQNLTKLSELNLDGVRIRSTKGNDWSHAISSSLPNLRVLSLSECELSGPIDSSFENLRFLSVINLSFNNLSSPIPQFLANFSNLSSLTLFESGLTGTFPEKIFEIPTLKILYVSNNDQLHGSLPDFYHNASLQILYLSNCKLSGMIPSSISNLRELVYLDLSFNNFSGPIPSFSFLKKMTRLYLIDNKLNGSISSTNWKELSNLENLDLGYNSLTREIPGSLFHAPSLQTVDLSHNQFTGSMNEFPNSSSSSKLKDLDLSCNRIHGGLPSWIWEMENLQWLNISHNFLTEVGKPLHGLTSNLAYVDLHANQIQGQIQFPPPFVQYVDYSSNNFSYVLSTALFRYLNSTRFLFLSSNNLQGSIPYTICSISLEVLDLSNNSLSGTIPECLFQNSPNLVALKLSSNKLTGPIPNKFARNCKLDYLDLSGNLLEGNISRSMENCKGLQFLNLGKNQLTDIFPQHLTKISTIQVLGLQSNKLHGFVDCPKNKGSWRNLHMINIASNNFGGELPENCFQTWVGMMVHKNEDKALGVFSWRVHMDAREYETIIGGSYFYETFVTIKGQEMELPKIFIDYTFIDFSCNDFQGKIPKVIGELKELRFLNLSHNSLDGRIPPSMGRMKNLESLDLSRNNLSGLIPSELASLTFLGYGDFSHNQFIGQIPTSTQLQSFPSSHFEGNPGLCGSPLKTECSKQNLPREPHDPSNSRSEIEWNFISIEVGFTFGLGVVILPLTLSRRWRIQYYRHVERVLFKLLPILDPRNYRSRERKVENLQNLKRH